MKYTKIRTAEVQLECAVRLLFSGSDPIPIETLCGAAIGVLRPLAKLHGIQSPLHDSDWIKDEYRTYWVNKLHEAQNFSKHADKDTTATLEYDPAVVPIRIAEAGYLYKMLSYPARMNYAVGKFITVFDLWLSLKYPNLIKKDNLSWQRIVEQFKTVEPDPDDLNYFLLLIK